MHPYSKEMRKFCLADKTVNSFVIAVYMPMMCWRNGVLVNWKNDDLFSDVEILEALIPKITFHSFGVIRRYVLEEVISYSLHQNGKIIVLQIYSSSFWDSHQIVENRYGE